MKSSHGLWLGWLAVLIGLAACAPNRQAIKTDEPVPTPTTLVVVESTPEPTATLEPAWEPTPLPSAVVPGFVNPGPRRPFGPVTVEPTLEPTLEPEPAQMIEKSAPLSAWTPTPVVAAVPATSASAGGTWRVIGWIVLIAALALVGGALLAAWRKTINQRMVAGREEDQRRLSEERARQAAAELHAQRRAPTPAETFPTPRAEAPAQPMPAEPEPWMGPAESETEPVKETTMAPVEAPRTGPAAKATRAKKTVKKTVAAKTASHSFKRNVKTPKTTARKISTAGSARPRKRKTEA